MVKENGSEVESVRPGTGAPTENLRNFTSEPALVQYTGTNLNIQWSSTCRQFNTLNKYLYYSNVYTEF